jgi:hypothetical protein
MCVGQFLFIFVFWYLISYVFDIFFILSFIVCFYFFMHSFFNEDSLLLYIFGERVLGFLFRLFLRDFFLGGMIGNKLFTFIYFYIFIRWKILKTFMTLIFNWLQTKIYVLDFYFNSTGFFLKNSVVLFNYVVL